MLRLRNVSFSAGTALWTVPESDVNAGRGFFRSPAPVKCSEVAWGEGAGRAGVAPSGCAFRRLPVVP